MVKPSAMEETDPERRDRGARGKNEGYWHADGIHPKAGTGSAIIDRIPAVSRRSSRQDRRALDTSDKTRLVNRP